MTIQFQDFDPTTHDGALPSPCNNICRISQITGLCEGCLRSIDEITQWRCASETKKRSIWLAIKQRTKQI